MCLVLSVALGGLKNTLLQPCNHLAVQQHPAPCSPRKPRPMKAQVLCPSLQSYFLPHELPELHQWLYRMHFTVWRLLASHTLSNLRTTASRLALLLRFRRRTLGFYELHLIYPGHSHVAANLPDRRLRRGEALQRRDRGRGTHNLRQRHCRCTLSGLLGEVY